MHKKVLKSVENNLSFRNSEVAVYNISVCNVNEKLAEQGIHFCHDLGPVVQN